MILVPVWGLYALLGVFVFGMVIVVWGSLSIVREIKDFQEARRHYEDKLHELEEMEDH